MDIASVADCIGIRGGKVGKVYKEGPFRPELKKKSATIQIVVYSSEFQSVLSL